MNVVSVKEAWIALMEKDLGPEGLFDVVKDIERDGLFVNWKRKSSPVSLQYLDYAIDLLCGAPEQTKLIATFIGHIRQQIERAKTEPQRWEREESGEWGFWFMKATRWYDLLRADMYSRALLGEALVIEAEHFDALQASAADYSAEKGRSWDELPQTHYVECALVAAAWGRLDLAQELLKVRRSFKYAQRYLDWSRSLVDQLLQLSPGQVVEPDEPLWTHFHSLFDEVRHPTLLMKVGEASREAARRGEAIGSSSWSLLRLDLAMIKQRYLLGKPVAPGMRDLIGLISE